jgi:hypothetical protein
MKKSGGKEKEGEKICTKRKKSPKNIESWAFKMILKKSYKNKEI